jgi:uncharacterized membrane protein (UPF0127 family)
MKKLILFGIFFVVIFYFTDFSSILENKDESKRDNKISLGDCSFEIEIVSDDDSRRRGLSNRKSLCDECGMLFDFPKEDKRSFWMKDMSFPLDIIWLRDNKVVGIEKNVPENFPDNLESPEEIDRVLEINAKKSEVCNIKKGSVLKYVD